VNGIEVSGDVEITARLQSFPARLSQRLQETLARLGVALQAEVAENLSGRVLHRRSGALIGAVRQELSSAKQASALSVGFDADAVPYGAIQEFGGRTRAHLIAAKNARALAFSLGGKLVFAKQVNHPGSVLPERSFLRSALAALAPAALAEIDQAVAEEIEA
jgi:hypothetical protein